MVVPELHLNLPWEDQVWCSMCSRRTWVGARGQIQCHELKSHWTVPLVTGLNQISPNAWPHCGRESTCGRHCSLHLHLISFSFEAMYFPQGKFLKLRPFNLGEQFFIKGKLNFVCFLPDPLTFWDYVFCFWGAFFLLSSTINSLLFNILLTTTL